jgi:hypothetical protein
MNQKYVIFHECIDSEIIAQIPQSQVKFRQELITPRNEGQVEMLRKGLDLFSYLSKTRY